MSSIIHIYLIRHARQRSPLCNVNVPLADEGLLQSKLLGERLKSYNIDKVYSSNLIRAQMTAAVVREQLGLIETDISACESEKLRETDFGLLTGLEDKVLRERFKEYFEQREDTDEDICIPGGENGEQVYSRMKQAVNEIIAQAIKNNYENVAVVTHGGAIRCYLAGILKMPFGRRFSIAKNMENCSITQIDYCISSKTLSVEKINDYSHLENHENLLRKNFKRTV